MRRPFATTVAATLAFGCGSALAQGGDLAGVTMRVLDDISDIDAVIIELDAGRGEDDEDAESDRSESTDEAGAVEPGAAEQDDERGQRDDLHEPADDERGEGRLEDDDIERPAVEPPA